MVQIDQRISLVAGYMTEEVSGLSPFNFMHKDDVRWVMVALRQSKFKIHLKKNQLTAILFLVYDFSTPHGESCYRLMTRTGKFIYLKTRGYLEIQTDSNKVHTFCCINTLVSEEEGKKLVREMKKKFSVIIAGNEIAPNDSDVPELEKPEQLERAVLDMITDLQNQENPDNESVSSPASSHESDARDSKSPPAIIAPTALTIKDSIKKTVGVIVAASRGIYSKISDNTENVVSHRPSVLQKTKTYTETILNPKTISSNYKSSEIIEIKTEPIDITNYNESTSRVPPLPNQKGYFDIEYFDLNNQTTTPLSSPPENIKTNFEIITIKKSPQNYWDSCSQDESRFYELNGKSPTDTTKNEPIGRNSSVLKRTHPNENYDEAAKRRIVFGLEGEESSLLSPCINQLTNPNSGEI